jgi:(p)ppGpp synthase/HD superfamily hydrolase
MRQNDLENEAGVAKAVARIAHKGQKYGKPVPTLDYFEAHVQKVAQRVEDAGLSIEHIAVAYLHDTVEDTPLTLDDLRKMGFSDAVIAGVDGMTRREGETYRVFIQRARANPLSNQVKFHDISANLAACAGPETDGLKKRYIKALQEWD